MVDVFRNVACAAGLRQVAYCGHRRSDPQVEKKPFACVQRQILSPGPLITHRFKLITDGLSFLVQIHVNLDVARIGLIITIYVAFATCLFAPRSILRIDVFLGVNDLI
ncbi:hypothetical protein BN2475_530008 [Paraburkholderia ribeironis]|uniref:Uncharacterized protein n=1 Tax=Paraburkholderia ribeironis TaxID=1247936 RepID=A0A1N7SCN5_9BURK|nr:hypothetical protein BN2475_530008 [Paraburkholderia ribeironis]